MSRLVAVAAAVASALLVPRDGRAAPCGGIPAAGCCDGTTLKFCRSDGTLATVNCNGQYSGGGLCAWDFGHEDETNGHYTCTAETNPNNTVQVDPTGAVPRACPAPAGACIPDCTGKQCGDDGCSGTCGTCPSGTCRSFTCQPTGTFCGDAALPPFTGCCEGPMYKYCSEFSGVNAYSCDAKGLDRRCGVADGQGGCYLPASISALPNCPAPACQRNCTGKSCGDDGCGGSCGGCAAGQQCNNGACATPSCTPACGRGQVCTFAGCQWQQCIAPLYKNSTLTLVMSGSAAVWGGANLKYLTSDYNATWPIDRLPSAGQGMRALAVGDTHIVAVDNNGTPYEWGGWYGCGGEPSELPASARPIQAVSAWRCNFAAIYGTGKVVVWGPGNAQSQSAYADGITDAVAVAAGGNFLVLHADGTVSMFSSPDSPADVHDFYYRYLGTPAGEALWDSTAERFVSYVKALPGIVGATAIAATGRHYSVLNGDGTIVDWGSAWLGYTPPPRDIAQNVLQVAVDGSFSLALLKSGALRMWIDDPQNPYQRGLLANVPARRDFVAIAPGPGALARDGGLVLWDRDGPIAVPAELGFVTNFAVGYDRGADFIGVAVTRCTQGCTPSCNANTCQADGCGGICPNCGGCDPRVASCLCVPQCSGRQCGDDRCGGTCGTCGAGSVCTSTTGRCACVPDCNGKTCGPNGCGGSCGACTAPATCTPAGVCACDHASNCRGKSCGDDGCGGTCGTCPSGSACSETGICECVPNCDGKSCGGDGCGGSCGYCGPGKQCTAAGTCECRPSCKVQSCDSTGCDIGYTKICGPDGCGGSCGTCPAGETCNESQTGCGCVATCEGKECGGDGCGGLCPFPPCPLGKRCVAGQCVCQPKCTDWPEGINGCGNDGCGGSCGTCGPGTYCNNRLGPGGTITSEGICECSPSCSGRECGPDGCGGACGADQFNTSSIPGCAVLYGRAWACTTAGQCECIPDCYGKLCGGDGCGGSCGKCPAGRMCSDDDPRPNPLKGQGHCQCKPDCDGRVCGPDGCGGSCGTCNLLTGQVCDEQKGQCSADPCPNFPAAGCCQTAANGDSLQVSCDATSHKITLRGCGRGGWACGWYEEGIRKYICGGAGAEDPTGVHPIACPAGVCIPDCYGKQCGPDGCGGSCGEGCGGVGATCVGGRCVGGCFPNCRANARQCGSDGCGGSCGSCASGQVCVDSVGRCCTPNCSNKVCGSDGCGGSCGSCPSGQICDGGSQCKTPACNGFPILHGCCEPGNVEVYCDTSTNKIVRRACDAFTPKRYCGWSAAAGGYRCGSNTSYPVDPSGNDPYLCPADLCVPNCNAKLCGPDGCGGTCGACASGETCSPAGRCYVPCVPDCSHGRCGEAGYDGCGNPCGCPAGQACEPPVWGVSWGDLRSGGKCGPPCQGQAPVDIGCCASYYDLWSRIPAQVGANRAVWTCPSASTGSYTGMQVTRCPADKLCGWSSAAGKFTCGGADTPPLNVTAACPINCSCKTLSGASFQCGDDGCGNPCPGTCSAGNGCVGNECQTCYAECFGFRGDGYRGKQCGDNGCGGVCGTCPGQSTCDDPSLAGNGRCQLPSSCGSVTAAGACNGDTAQYCTAYGIQTVDCTLSGGHCAEGQCVAGAAGSTAHSCAAGDCGRQNAAWACQCDAACASRHDCCPNYDSVCGAATSTGSCGDHLCQSGAGEDCLTCSGDCGACPALAATSSSVVAPYHELLHSVGRPGQYASFEVVPIDDVRPSGPPWSRKGLVAYLPEPGVNAGSLRTFALNDGSVQSSGGRTLGGEVLAVADGMQGKAFSFNGTGAVRDGSGLCAGRACGPDGANGSCGTCPSGKSCDLFFGTCYVPINPDDLYPSCKSNVCERRNCGSDGCGRACKDGQLDLNGDGSCPNNGYCTYDGRCEPKATIDDLGWCTGRECGRSPWHGLVCGACKSGTACGSDGLCHDDVSNHGLLRIVPGELVPRDGSYANHTAGGATLAFWVRVPPDSLDYVNPLASTLPIVGPGEVCGWTRPGDTKLTLKCAFGRVVAAEAYWGSVGSTPTPPGSCEAFHRIRRASCASKAPATDVKRCVGTFNCPLDYTGSSDTCDAERGTSVLAMRIVCSDISVAAATLYVGDAREGNHLRLVLPGQADVVGRTSLKAGAWTHVALSHERVGRGLGDVTLWMNGASVGRANNVVFPDAYEWDVGAGYFPGFPSVPNAINGNLVVRNLSGQVREFYGSLNVAGSADVDDVFLYNRALSEAEIRALYRKPGAGALRVWPALDPARTLLEGTSANASAVPVEAKALLDAARSTAANPVRFAADEPALGLPSGASFAAADAAPDLAELSTFTLAGWVRPSTLAAGTKLLDLTEGTTSQLALITASVCSGGALTASLNGGSALAAVTTCEHGLAANDWAFVAYVQDQAAQSVYVDGVLTASGTSPAKIFTATNGSARTFRAGNGVDLAWASLFASAFGPDELEALRWQGPTVWIEGSVALDLAAFRNNASGTAVDAAVLWTGAKGLASAGSGATVTVPARGRFRTPKGGAERVFSWSGQVGFPSTVGSAALTIPLFALEKPGSRRADASLSCRAADASGNVACHVLVNGAGADGRYHHWASDVRIASRSALAAGGTARIAVAFNGVPTAAMYFADDGEPLSGEARALLTVGEIGTPSSAPSSTAAAEQFTLPAPSGGASTSATWSDVRLYARVLSPTELAALVQRGCAAQQCDDVDRVCATPAALPGAAAASLDLTTCGGCAAGLVERGGVCRPRQRFDDRCVENAECETGVCGPYLRCLQPAADSTCKSTCLEKGRDCVQVEATSYYTCSTACRKHFEASGADCVWRWKAQPGEPCRDDYECASAKCEASSRTGYLVKREVADYVYPGGLGKAPPWVCGADDADGKAGKCAVVSTPPVESRCAGYDDLACEEQHRVGVPKTAIVPGIGSTTVYNCGGCKDGYRQAWTLLSPEACATMWKNYYALGDNRNLNYQGNGELYEEPSLTTLRRLLLQDASPTSLMTPALYAKLDVAGAGPVLLNWAKLSEDEKGRYRWPPANGDPRFGDYHSSRMLLGACNVASDSYRALVGPHYDKDGRLVVDASGQMIGYEVRPWTTAYRDPSLNYQACVAKRWPNGAQCPQPEVKLDRAHAGQNCMSGFCAADTGTCEDGFGPDFEDVQGATRNDGQFGAHGVGSLSLVQTSNSFVRVSPTDDQSVTDKRTYGIGLGTAYTVDVFGLLQFDVLNVDVKVTTEKEKKKAEYSQAVSIFGLDVPIPPPDRPASMEEITHPLAGCDSAEWSNGEWAAPDCDVKLKPDGSIDVAETVEPLELEIPIPIGDCKEVSSGPGLATHEKGKLCFKRTVMVSFVPITLTAEVELTAFLRLGAVVDPRQMEPAFIVAPGVGIGLSVHGGVGAQTDVITAYAGVKADITIVEVSFPVTWTLHADVLSDAQKKIVNNLYQVKYTRDLSLELRFLKMALGIFVELGVGPFTHEWDWDLFGFDGIKVRWTLASADLLKTKVDFDYQP